MFSIGYLNDYFSYFSGQQQNMTLTLDSQNLLEKSIKKKVNIYLGRVFKALLKIALVFSLTSLFLLYILTKVKIS